MLTGDEVKAARARARMTQEQAAQEAGVSLRTWGNWERTATLPPALEARAREVIGAYLAEDRPAPVTALSSVSDAQLLAEIAARFERGRRHGTATKDAGATPAKPPAPPRRLAAARTTTTPRRSQARRLQQDGDAEGPQSP